jgi:hypothetical protein
MTGKALTNIEMEKIGFNKITAITICYSQLVSLEKLAKNFPVLETDFEQYQNIINPMENEENFINKTLEICEVFRRMINRPDERKGNYETLKNISISFFGKKKILVIMIKKKLNMRSKLKLKV